VQTSKAIAFWLLIYLAASPLLTSALVFIGRAPNYPVFETFQGAAALWRTAFFLSGLFAALTAYLLRRSSKTAIFSAIVFLALFVPSFMVVWGQISLGIWIGVAATALVIFVSLKTRSEA
jgi:hypothetical protein